MKNRWTGGDEETVVRCGEVTDRAGGVTENGW